MLLEHQGNAPNETEQYSDEYHLFPPPRSVRGGRKAYHKKCWNNVLPITFLGKFLIIKELARWYVE